MLNVEAYADKMYSTLTSLGYSGATLDMFFKYLGEQGYTGSFPDRLFAFLVAMDKINLTHTEFISQLDSNTFLTTVMDIFNLLQNPTAVYTGGALTTTDYEGTLVSSPANIAGFEGGRLATTVAEGAMLGPELASTVKAITGLVINGDGTYTYNGTAVTWTDTTAAYPAGRYQTIVTVISGNGVTISYQTGGSFVAVPGIYTTEGATIASDNIILTGGFVGTIRISFRKVIPVWYDTLPDGTPLQSSALVPTKSGTKKWYQEPFATPFGYSNWPARTNKCTCRKFNPVDTTNITKSGDAAAVLSVVDDTAALTAAGLIGICTSGKVYKLDNSGGSSYAYTTLAGAVANINVHTQSVYCRKASTPSPRMSDTAFMSAVTITTTNYSGYTRTWTPDGAGRSVMFEAAPGAIVYFILPQLEEGAFATPPIFDLLNDSLTSITRAATNLSLSATNIIAANDFGQLLEWIPGATGQTGVLWSTRVDASNYTQISCTPTQILYTKVISGVATTVTVTYTHTVNVPVRIQAHQDSVLGMSLRVRQQGAAWSAYVTDPSVSAQPVGATYQEGAINNTTHAAGYYPGNFFVTGNLAKLESEVAKVS